MFCRTRRLRQRLARVHEPDLDRARPRRRAARHHRRHPARAVGDARDRALTTITIKLPANNAILVLICSYVGALYGGSRTAILLNIPGTAANAASCADGYALAQRGEAGRAIGIATSGAFTGTLFGVLCLAAFTPSLAEVALAFGAFEFFWLALFGVAMSGSIVGDDPLKGWLMGALGLFVAQIGQEGLYAYDRFTFGWDELAGGISLIPALVGAFGLAEVLTALADPVEKKLVEVKDSVLPRFREVFQYWRTVIRSGVIGVVTGLLPGVGEDSGAWMSYAAAKAVSKEKHLFGKGSIDGLMAAETGDMASIPGHIIPCLALGIPGSAPSAVLMAAMIIHGIQPGPMLMISNPHFVYEVVAMTSLATLTILIFGLFLVRPLLVILTIRRTVLMPIIFLLCTVGAFATRVAPVRRLRDARRSASARSSCAGAATRWRRSCSASSSGRCSTRACAAAWSSPTAAWRRSSRGRSRSPSRS